MGTLCVLEPGPPGRESRPAARWSAALGASSDPAAGPRFPHLESEMITAGLQGAVGIRGEVQAAWLARGTPVGSPLVSFYFQNAALLC